MSIAALPSDSPLSYASQTEGHSCEVSIHMTTPEPESFDDLELTDDWVKGARKHEQSADARVERYTQIQQAHATARPPRSWTPAESGGTSVGAADLGQGDGDRPDRHRCRNGPLDDPRLGLTGC